MGMISRIIIKTISYRSIFMLSMPDRDALAHLFITKWLSRYTKICM